jgi:archaellum component FlaC
MAGITRNEIEKAPAQNAGAIRKTDPYDFTRRRIRLNEAEAGFDQTGDFEKFKKDEGLIREQTLGGSAEAANLDIASRNIEEKDYGRRVSIAEEAAKLEPTTENVDKLRSEVSSGFNLFGKESKQGVQIAKNLRSVDTTENNRKLADIEFNWKNDPMTHQEEYKTELQRQIDYYGPDTIDGLTLKTKLYNAEEEGMLSDVRTAMNDYDLDPVSSIERLRTAQERLTEFYGSSADGYYARQTLNNINSKEQERLDTSATTDYTSGKISYDGYYSYLVASAAKYPEGSAEHMKYYGASETLKFQKTLDDLVRLQFSSPQGEVMSQMKTYQGTLAAGSDAYNQVQDQIDNIDYQIRYNAYQDMLKKEVGSRQEQVNDLQVKLYGLQSDYESGTISKSKFTSKYKSYNNKIDYLSSSQTLPAFELYKTY